MNQYKRPHFEVLVASAPDRKRTVAECWVDGIHFAELSDDEGAPRFEIYPRLDGTPWRFSDLELEALLRRARKALGYSTDRPTSVDLRLSASRALWGAVTANLRAFSIGLDDTVIHTRSIFDADPTSDERDLITSAGAEIVADYGSDITIEEEFIVARAPMKMEHLAHLIFLRHEQQQ